MSDYKIVGTVVDRDQQSPLSGLKVEAWDKDLLLDDHLGTSETDSEGRFTIEFDDTAFRDLYLENKPDVFFRVFEHDILIESTEDAVIWNVGSGTTELLLEVSIEGGASDSSDDLPELPAEWSRVPADEIGPADFDRIKRLHLTGSVPYSDRELIARRQVISTEMDAVYQEAEEIGLAPDLLFQTSGASPTTPIYSLRDNGSNGREGRPPTSSGTSTTPCCTPAQIAAGLVKIKAAYTAAVAKVSKWKGCQDWSVIVAQAVQASLPPCWVGKYVWRIKVWPFGRWTPFDDGDTFIHHAYAICPCTCPSFGGCTECIVLDPYTITGFATFQSARTYPFADWIKEGNVWRASTNPDHDNCAIYRYTMRYYCARSRTGGWAQKGTCKAVRKLLMRETARYTGASGATLQRLYRTCGLIPDCC